jgi:transposase
VAYFPQGFTNHQLSDSWEVGLRRADRWSALAYATTNGIGSKIFCLVAKVGGMAPDNQLLVEAMLNRFRTGVPWQDLPARFGYWKSEHHRFGRRAKSGVFERTCQLLASDADNEYMMIDATIVRAHQHSPALKKDGHQAIGRSRGGLTRKFTPWSMAWAILPI